jgi:predicted methyltransferase
MTASSNVPDSDSLTTPLLTLQVHEALIGAARAGVASIECSLDLMKTRSVVEIDAEGWCWRGQRYPYLETCKERTIYFWDRSSFAPIARYSTSLIKLVPTQWGPPTFEIDGIKMLPTAHVSPFDDAQRKVGLIQPRGKRILDTCGGLGYFASWCLAGSAAHVLSFEKNPDVIWLRSLNSWSPRGDETRDARLDFKLGDVVESIGSLASDSFDAVLHDPPRFGIAGELYSQSFYDQLARVLKRKGRLFHYTGTPNKLTSGRDVPAEVANRLRRAGFTTRMEGDGVLAAKGAR